VGVAPERDVVAEGFVAPALDVVHESVAEVGTGVVEHVVDGGESAGTMDRPGWRRVTSLVDA